MAYEPEAYQRRSLRLPEYDYSQPGAYFVTMCTLDRKCVFGNMVDGSVQLSPAGEIADQSLGVQKKDIRQEPVALGRIAGFYKFRTTKLIGTLYKDPALRVWQKNYYEHVVRNDADLERIRQYTADNPLQWELDEENPKNIRPNSSRR